MLFDDIALVRAYRALDRSQRRLVRAAARTALLTLVLLWLAPFLSVAAPGALWSRDSLAAVLACVTRLPEALSVVREERARTAAEKDAFERFADRVRRMEVADPTEQKAVVGVDSAVTEQPSSGTDVAAVREAYRETVMATDHYEEEYDESLATNVATEFGPDYATALAGAESLTPPLQGALVEASHRAARERASFLHTLDRELDALVDARRRLRQVAETTAELRETPFERRSFGEVVDAEDRVEALERECDAVVEERRTTLRDQPERDGTDLREYLYGGREWRYPVVGDALDCLANVRAARRRLVKAVLRRP